MFFSVLWNGLGLISLAAMIELVSVAVCELRGSTARDIVLSVFVGIVCALLALAAFFLPLLYTDYMTRLVEQISPAMQLLLVPLVLSVVTFTLSFVVARFFKNSFPHAVICAVAVLCSTTAIFLPIGYGWLMKGMAFAEGLPV